MWLIIHPGIQVSHVSQRVKGLVQTDDWYIPPLAQYQERMVVFYNVWKYKSYLENILSR